MEDRVAVMTRHIHWSDPTPASMKVSQVLPALQPTAVTELASLGGPITEALAIARAGVVLVEINYCCLGTSVS